jgi:hypothetical protein
MIDHIKIFILPYLIHYRYISIPWLLDKTNRTIPPYAILSHRWWGDSLVVHYHELLNDTYASKDGYRKIKFASYSMKVD